MSQIVKCPVCSVDYDIRGFPTHLATKHPSEFAKNNGIIPVANTGNVSLEDSGNLKADIVTLQDSVKAKDIELAELRDSISQKETEFATLHDEIGQLSSLEHEQNIVRHTLKSLNKEAYVAIGQQLGFVAISRPQPATVEEATTQARAGATRDAHNVEAVGSILPPAATAQVEDKEPEIFIGKKEGDGWKYFDGLGFSVKE